MNLPLRLGAVCAVASAAIAQSPSVDVSGESRILWQGAGPVQSSTFSLVGPMLHQVETVGSVNFNVHELRVTATVSALSPPGPPGSGWWSHAQADVLIEYEAPWPMSGVIRGSLAPVCSQAPSFFDVGDDGSPEIASGTATPVDVPVVLTSARIPVRLDASTTNFGGATCLHTASVEFFAQPSPTFQHIAIGCGPQMSAAMPTRLDGSRDLKLWLDAAFGDAGAVVVGTSPGPAWPFLCPLYTDILAVAPLFPSNGTAELTIPIGTSGTYRVQYIELMLGAFNEVRTSNAIMVNVAP